jgi:hypothetical protein
MGYLILGPDHSSKESLMLRPSIFAVTAVIALSATAASTQVIAALAGNAVASDALWEPMAKVADRGPVDKGPISFRNSSAILRTGSVVQSSKVASEGKTSTARTVALLLN